MLYIQRVSAPKVLGGPNSVLCQKISKDLFLAMIHSALVTPRILKIKMARNILEQSHVFIYDVA